MNQPMKWAMFVPECHCVALNDQHVPQQCYVDELYRRWPLQYLRYLVSYCVWTVFRRCCHEFHHHCRSRCPFHYYSDNCSVQVSLHWSLLFRHRHHFHRHLPAVDYSATMTLSRMSYSIAGTLAAKIVVAQIFDIVDVTGQTKRNLFL